MLLDLESSPVPMRRVYSLAIELEQDARRVAQAQELTLDSSKPLLGLKGTFGLFGSDEWWANVNQREIPLLFLSGVIQRSYFAGQDSGGRNNTVDLVLSDGSISTAGIYTNDTRDVELFSPGHLVHAAYALDELKRQPAPDGGVNYSRVALEMAISEEPR